MGMRSYLLVQYMLIIVSLEKPNVSLPMTHNIFQNYPTIVPEEHNGNKFYITSVMARLN